MSNGLAVVLNQFGTEIENLEDINLIETTIDNYINNSHTFNLNNKELYILNLALELTKQGSQLHREILVRTDFCEDFAGENAGGAVAAVLYGVGAYVGGILVGIYAGIYTGGLIGGPVGSVVGGIVGGIAGGIFGFEPSMSVGEWYLDKVRKELYEDCEECLPPTHLAIDVEDDCSFTATFTPIGAGEDVTLLSWSAEKADPASQEGTRSAPKTFTQIDAGEPIRFTVTSSCALLGELNPPSLITIIDLDDIQATVPSNAVIAIGEDFVKNSGNKWCSWTTKRHTIFIWRISGPESR
ncbi:MAG: hypothetical protein ACI86M_000169 [Saprospiraceae bacterium]|jgi:hypothetical protein